MLGSLLFAIFFIIPPKSENQTIKENKLSYKMYEWKYKCVDTEINIKLNGKRILKELFDFDKFFLFYLIL